MNKLKFSFSVAVLMALSIVTVAQTKPARSTHSKGVRRGLPALRAAMADVSSKQLQSNIEKLVSFGTRNTLSDQSEAAISQGRGIGAAREWIKSEFERYSKECGGCLEVKEDRFTQEPTSRIPNPTEIVNVYAVLHGTDPVNAQRIYLISGHYDSRGTDVMNANGPAPGANDDGSGVAAVLESARVLSKHQFPATIIFLTVAGEEQGLNGSEHFAKVAKDQGWDIEAVLNNDTVGGDKSPGQRNAVRVFAEGVPLVDLTGAGNIRALRRIRALGFENDSSSREVARYVRQTAAAYRIPTTVEMIWRPDRYLRGGDHTSFNEQGFAAVRMTEWRENYDHQHQDPRTANGVEYGDLPKFVNFEFLANVTRLDVATLGSLAAAPAPPASVHLITRDLTNDSTLTWQPSPGGLAAGYEVMWRDTTSPVWQHSEKLPANTTSATVHESKDNVIFGVRAFGKEPGAESLVVVPLPER